MVQKHMELLKEYKFKNFPLYVEMSKGGRPVYYTDEKKLPKKIIKGLGTFYEFKEKAVIRNKKKTTIKIVVDRLTKEPVIKSISKPNVMKIGGQKLHELTLMPYQRSIMIETLKEYFVKSMIEQGIIKELNEKDTIYIHLLFIVDKKHISSTSKQGEDIEDKKVGDLDSLELFYKKTLFDCFQTKLARRGDILPVYNKAGFIERDNAMILNDYRVSYKHQKDRRDLLVRIFKTDRKS